ncbi:MAG: chemotaxis protein CheX [Clostridiales bacterium]|nr:chemotaxis protein CheX [Clostridiales bacterium]
MNTAYIEKFIAAGKTVFESFGMNVETGDISYKTSPYHADNLVIVIGLTGDLHGQAIISTQHKTACSISSVMMGGDIASFNEEVKSAIAELSNMITGNAITLLSQADIFLDMTPPSVLTGENMSISAISKSLIIPFIIDNGIMELSLCAKELATD